MENLNNNLRLSGYFDVFCDSKEALDWAYKNGLPETAIIYTSSPALLWEDNRHIKHVESRWKLEDMREFQTSIQKFSENIFSKILSLDEVSHEEALCVTRSATIFHRVLYKAACLNQHDLTKPRLIIQVEGKGGSLGNTMNPPWLSLLKDNDQLKTVKYSLVNDKWDTLTVHNAPWRERLHIGGFSSLIYRLAIKITDILPIKLSKYTALISSENELIIETASELLLKGVSLKKIDIPNKTNISLFDSKKLQIIKEKIEPIVRSRIKDWISPCFIDKCEEFFFEEVSTQLNLFHEFEKQWLDIILNQGTNSTNILLTNAPISTKRLALTSVCRQKGIPTISAQHGVTFEICKTHGELSFLHDINSTDLFLAYNSFSEKSANDSFFARGKSFVSGISGRHFRLKTSKNIITDLPIVYISTNLYKGNIGLFSTWLTDYDRAKNESMIVSKVLSKLPHKIRYKTYPEDNRRYPDHDPILDDVLKAGNIELFDQKIDMRFLINQHRVLVTSKATSTLGWLIMSGKPLIFINREDNMPLTNAAYKELSNGIFLFDGDKDGFHEELRVFLSKPIEEIELLWKDKEERRKIMIERYFSAYSSNSGKRAATFIKSSYMTHSES